MDAAEALVMLSDRAHFRTGRGGRHVEVGYALARGKRIILVGERENVFHWLCECVPTVIDAAHLLTNPPPGGKPACATLSVDGASALSRTNVASERAGLSPGQEVER